ncbi:MAG TPA: protein BatD [Bacteroidetes bacterium]|nr:protein BatD [Bacteroidota bacterium]
MFRKTITFLIFAFILSGTKELVAQDIVLKTYVDRTTVPLNQQFVLSVEISGKDANHAPEPNLPDISDFAALSGSSSSQSIQIVNGRMSISRTINYYYVATKVGKFNIPAVQIEMRGKTFKSAPIEIEITQAAASPPKSQQRPRATVRPESSVAGNLFLKVKFNKSKVYQNEPVLVTYKIYTRVEVISYSIKKLPKAVGFWVENFPMPQQPTTHEEIVNGKKYVVAEVKKMALFPTDPGLKVIEPMEMVCEVQLRQKRRSRDIFDQFFSDDFFGNSFFGRRIQTKLESKPVKIKVLPLPTIGKPADFSGAVGQFQLNASVDKNVVQTNEAITLKVKISGRGNIKMVREPNIAFPPDFEKYPPKVLEKINRQNNMISGNKVFEYVLIPRYAGEQRIPPFSFSYFDPANKKYKTLWSPEFVIKVAKGKEEFVSLGSGLLSKEEVKLVGKDIRFIKMNSPKFFRKNVYFNSSFLLIIFILPLFAVAGALGYRYRANKLAVNVAYARSQRANRIAKSRLRRAEKLLAVESQKEYYAEIFRALLGFVADKFNLPAAGVMTDQIAELLSSKGINDEIIRQYLECLQTCDYQRFAPANSTLQEMKSFYEKARKAIVQLEKTL